MFGFLKKDPADKYKKQIMEAQRLIRQYEQKYKMTSEDFISRRYSKRKVMDVEAADANNWATYLTIGKAM